MRRIGIDVGGTFTDVVLFDDATGAVWSTKVPTVPRDPTTGTIFGIQRILELSGSSPADVGFIGHGTTIATNMIVEGQGAKTGLITTRGFRDILEIRRSWRHDRADLYDLFFENPPPLVPRHLRLEVDERTLHDGRIERELSARDLDQCLEVFQREGVEAIAVCFINSHVNGANERAALRRIRERFGEAFLTGSVEVNPEVMEYERTCTTVVNASLGPRCGQYARTFLHKARDIGIRGDIFFMQSNGGLTRPEIVSERPVTLLGSGPAGGVTAATRFCGSLGRPNAITGDMGGTSFDVSLIRAGQAELRNVSMIKSYTVRCPNIDITSIGAGGGSIGWIDAGGGVRIGPESAGADPGPACYGRGGEHPTVTDCNLVLGYVDEKSFLGGDFALDRAAAEKAIRIHLAEPLGVDIEEAAMAVRKVANGLMGQAIRLMTVERGYDPRDFIYIPFGGAGPVHAVDLARELEIPTVVLPPMPGLFSAFGMLVADMLHDLQATVGRNFDELDPDDLEKKIAGLETEARGRMADAKVDTDLLTLERYADCCYIGQGETIQVGVPSGALDRDALSAIAGDFGKAHRRHWNFEQKQTPVHIVNVRVRAIGKIGHFAMTPARARHESSPQSVGDARVRSGKGWLSMPRYKREDLRRGDRLSGPLAIEELSTRITIDAGDRLEVGDNNTIVITVGKARAWTA